MIDIYFVVGLLFVGYVVGQFLEKRHFRAIAERERKLINLVTTSSRRPVGKLADVSRVELVSGSCCISIDYFKKLLAALRKFFGGNVRAYESLLDRARREAILRLKESCPDASQIINLRIETSSISKGHPNQIGTVEVLAYGTAIYE